MALAERFDLEIISVDSALVYRGMDIGTAKPDAADLRRVPHHLIDLIDPSDAYSAARFAEDATRQLAKRQLTWLRSMPDRHVVDCLAPDALQQVSALIETLGVSACGSFNPAT